MAAPVNGGSSGGLILGPTSAVSAPSMTSVISNASSSLSQILTVLKTIESTMATIVGHSETFAQNMSGEGAGTSNNGMPQRGASGGKQPQMPVFKMAIADAAVSMGMTALQNPGTSQQQMVANSVMFQRLAAASGQAYTNNGTQVYGQLQKGFTGYQSREDLLDTANSMFNMGWGPNALNPSTQQAMGQFATMTNNTLAHTQQIQASMISNPQTLMRARSFGITPLTRSGGPQNIQQTVSQVLQATWGGRTPSKSAVDSAMSPYGNLRQNFQNLGMSEEEISSLQPAIEAWATSGGGQFSSSNPAIAAAKGHTPLDSVRAKAQADTQKNVEQWHTMTASLIQANNALKDFTNLLNHLPFLRALGGIGAGVMGAVGGTAVGAGMGFAGAALIHSAAGKAKDWLGRRALGKGTGTLVTDAAETLPEDAGLIGAGGLATGTGIAIAGAASYLGTTELLKHTGLGGLADHYVGHDIFRRADVKPTAKLGSGTSDYLKSLGLTEDQFLAETRGLGHGATSGNATSASAPAQSFTTGGGIGKLLQVAESEVGVPYSWGGGGTNGPSKGINQGAGTVGFDCSSFVQFCFARIGIQLPRTTFEQMRCGVPVAPSRAQPGDLLFWEAGNHVSIYMGGGRMIESPHTGEDVRITSCNPKAAYAIRRVTKGGVGGTTVAGDNSGISGLISSSISSAMANANLLGMTIGGSLGMLSDGSSMSAGGSGAATPTPGKGGRYSKAAMVALAQAAGFTPAVANIMGAIGMAESSGTPTSHNTNASTGDNSYGLWQINMLGNLGPGRRREFGITDNNQLFQPAVNAHAAYDIYKGAGLGAWSTYTDGAYKRFLAEGAWNIKGNQTAQIHDGEMVIPKRIAEAIRESATASGKNTSGGKTVVINVYPASADHATAVKLAKMVEGILDEDKHLMAIGHG